jgi:hypothetical protein
MKKELTEIEKSLLKEEILSSNFHLKKQFNSTILYILLGVIISGIFNYWKYGYSIGLIFFSLILFTIFLIPLFIAFSISRKRINRLKNDLDSSFKIIGTKKIKSINYFNRKIKLSNGIKVFEPIESYKTFEKGDLINFKVSPSNEFIFECTKELKKHG